MNLILAFLAGAAFAFVFLVVIPFRGDERPYLDAAWGDL